MKPATHAVHAVAHTTGGKGVTPDMVLSTTFERAHDGTYPSQHVYSRSSNPNRVALQAALAQLEGGEVAFAFASGMAATASVVQSLSQGDHMLIPDDLYYGTRELVQSQFGRWGLASTAVDMTDHDAVRGALTPNTRLIWIETPSNPLLKVTDIAALAAIAHDAGAMLAVDSTWSTPFVQQPLALGADIVMHSSTKYIGGHSDVLGGAIVLGASVTEAMSPRLRDIQVYMGAVPAPFDCWLLGRSLPTLPLRVGRQCENAASLASFLAAHPAVHTVHYPGLSSHPQHAVAARQMTGGFGGMLSFQVNGGEVAARAVANGVTLITQATSLGGVESLIEHRASVEHNSTTPPDLLRFSVGIEDVDDLKADLSAALAAV